MKNDWLDRSEYPFPPRYFSINGQQLHYIDEGRGETLLFVHGTPSWSFDFRKLIKGLKADYRCVAVDHIGFGLSDKPERYDYSTQNHSQTLEKFVLEKQLENVTLVVHDFGAPIGLNVAMHHPERIKGLVILNAWLWSSTHDPDFAKLARALRNPLLPFLYRTLNFSPRFLLPRSFGDQKLSPSLLKQYTRPFKNRRQRQGPLAFARSLLLDQDWFESLWYKKYDIAEKPGLLIWGMKDPLIKPAFLAKFQAGFPQATTVVLDGCGHFPQEECPAEVEQAIRTFLGSGCGV